MADSASSAPVALVTGAARGIGLSIATHFLDAGYRVGMLDIDTETLAESVARLARPDAIVELSADVSDPGQVHTAVDTLLARFSRIDALVNNAGVASFEPVTDTSLASWREILSVNLDGAFICTQACVPTMLAQGQGAIVNITSISGLRASTLRTAYGTSKAALAHLTRQLAAELGNRGIRVNAVAPGPVDTAMAKKVHSADIRRDYHDAIPLNRYGTESEIARAVLFLCSDDSSYVNGQELAVDGGFGSTGIGLSTLRT